MRVLQVNKFLYGGAGAETVMFRTAELLRAGGHDVSFFAMQDPRNVPCAESDYFPRGRYYGVEAGIIQRARDAGSSIYSLQARKALRRLLRDRRPDVAHLHNIYHQLTMSVVDELVAQNIPTVMTLHDYKPVCPNYTLYTDHEPCHRCVASHPGHALIHRCIKGSRAASAVGVAEALLARTRHSYGRLNAFISPSRYLAEVMAEGGLPSDRMHVIQNFIANDQFRHGMVHHGSDAPMALFVGRLEEVKGVRVLIEAARAVASKVNIVVVGHGPLEVDVRRAHNEGFMQYLGHCDWEEIAQLMDRATALVVPSIWEENCPMTVLEAGARGCPTIASDRGGLMELVSHEQDGLLFPAGDVDTLAHTILRLGADVALSEQLGSAARARVSKTNTSDNYLSSLLTVYDAVRSRSLN